MKTYACIMAGGSGERFWPLSRIAKPKHLVPLLSATTLLEETVRRVEKALPASNIFVLTNAAQIEGCRAVLPELKAHQFIAEPAKRDTAPACALGTALVRNLDPDAVVVFLPADALIHDAATFARSSSKPPSSPRSTTPSSRLAFAPRTPRPASAIWKPAPRCPKAPRPAPFFNVERFVEKPDAARAETYLKSGKYFWNAGIFLWKVGTFMREAKRSKPELATFIEDFPKDKADAYIAAHFAALPKISVDYAIMEKAERVTVAEARFDWDDMGSWTALPAHLPLDEHGNTVRGGSAIHDSHGNIAIANEAPDRPVRREGPHRHRDRDAILVCHRNAAEQIKHLQPKLPDSVR